MPPRLVVPVLALAILAAVPALAAPSGAAAVPVATMTVSVTSLRMGKPFRNTLAKVRPGDSVLLRDETAVPYVASVDARGSRNGSATSGLVVTVLPAVRAGHFWLDLSSTVREVRLDTASVPGAAGAGRSVSVPTVTSRTFEESFEPDFAAGEWRATRALGDTGYGVLVVARPLAVPAPVPPAPVARR